MTDPIGEPEETLTPSERKWWDHIVSRAPLGVLTSADNGAVLLAAKLMDMAMTDLAKMEAAKLSRLHALLGSFGMTPSDRAKLSIGKAKKIENPYAHLDS